MEGDTFGIEVDCSNPTRSILHAQGCNVGKLKYRQQRIKYWTKSIRLLLVIRIFKDI